MKKAKLILADQLQTKKIQTLHVSTASWKTEGDNTIEEGPSRTLGHPWTRKQSSYFSH